MWDPFVCERWTFCFILCTSPENVKMGARAFAYAEGVKLQSRIRNDRYFVIISWMGNETIVHNEIARHE